MCTAVGDGAGSLICLPLVRAGGTAGDGWDCHPEHSEGALCFVQHSGCAKICREGAGPCHCELCANVYSLVIYTPLLCLTFDIYYMYNIR